MTHDPATCSRSYCPECDAYGDGYSAGKTKAFSEVGGYLYDPSRDSVVAARVGMREPEVTAWGDARPLAIEREVGAWDLTPTDDGIVLDEHDVEVEVGNSALRPKWRAAFVPKPRNALARLSWSTRCATTPTTFRRAPRPRPDGYRCSKTSRETRRQDGSHWRRATRAAQVEDGRLRTLGSPPTS